MEIIKLPKKYKNISELIMSDDFNLFRERAMKQFFKKHHESCSPSFNWGTNKRVYFTYGKPYRGYYQPQNILMRFCVFIELTENINYN